jgi:hypothetical protein
MLSGALVSSPLLPFVGDQPVLLWRPPEPRGRTLGGLVSPGVWARQWSHSATAIRAPGTSTPLRILY